MKTASHRCQAERQSEVMNMSVKSRGKRAVPFIFTWKNPFRFV